MLASSKEGDVFDTWMRPVIPNPEKLCEPWSILSICMHVHRSSAADSSDELGRGPTSQRPHFTGDGHRKPVLKEVKDQVELGPWTRRVM